MPHSHSHGGHSHGDAHGHSHGFQSTNHNNPDFWTNFNSVGEYLESSSDVLVYTIGFITIINQINESIHGNDIDSEPSDSFKHIVTGIAAPFALLLAIGAFYCHRILNSQFQEPSATIQISEEDCEHEEVAETEYSLLHEGHDEHEHPEQTQANFHHTLEEGNHHGHSHTDEGHAIDTDTLDYELANTQHHRAALTQQNKYALTTLQSILIYSDAVCHGMGRAGALMATIDYAIGYNMGIVPSPTVKLVTQCASTLFGLGFSVAEIRTCKNSLKQYNKAKIDEREARRLR